tara:strand:+ start:6523 stop:7143 length:621 start_codon:yes stop_codon:yes gene_type:complete
MGIRYEQRGVANNAITLAKMAGGTDGNLISYDASGDPVAVATGDAGQVLTSAGAGQPPAFGGNVTLGESAILLDHAIGTDARVSGITVGGTAGSSMVVGDVIYLNTDNAWDPTDADATASAVGMIGISLTAGSSGDITILLKGFVRVDAIFAFTTAGGPLYLSTTPGDMSQTAPSGSGDVVRVVGYAHDDDDTIFFSPDNSWVEIA